MLLAKGDLELVGMLLTATWPLGSHVNKGDREGSHGAHLNLQTVTMHRHHLDIVACPLTSWTPSIIVVRLSGWWGGLPSIIVIHPLGWQGGSPSVVAVSVGLVRWLAGHHCHLSIGLVRWLAACCSHSSVGLVRWLAVHCCLSVGLVRWLYCCCCLGGGWRWLKRAALLM